MSKLINCRVRELKILLRAQNELLQLQTVTSTVKSKTQFKFFITVNFSSRKHSFDKKNEKSNL